MNSILSRIVSPLMIMALLWSYTTEAQVVYTVGGSISGLVSGKTVTLLNNGGNPLTVSANGSLVFSNALNVGASYSVTVAIQPSGQVCMVTFGSGSITSSNISNVSVNCVATYTVGGSVSGLNATGLVLKLNATSLIVANGATSFRFATALVSNSTYTVTVGIQPVGLNCTVSNGVGTVSGASITNINIVCNKVYTISGSVTGLASSSFVLKLNTSTLIIPNGATTFKFSTGLSTGSPYAVTVGTQPTGQTCTVANGTGTIGSANITNVIITCKNTFKVEVWVDNWFSVYAGNTFVGEDSEPITQTKSFNAETFNFSANYPFDLNFLIKDYIQLDYLNGDTGLEYIANVGGTQQMGDGGFIMQLTDTGTNKLAAVSGTNFKCLVIHKAPANKNCASQVNPTTASNSCGLPTKLSEPNNWKDSGFSTAGWITPTVYTATQVGVKGGYSSIAWAPSAKLIWGADLQVDNTLLCKVSVTAPP